MKFVEPRPLADLDASAELKLIETNTIASLWSRSC
jgi:hypothetical protein